MVMQNCQWKEPSNQWFQRNLQMPNLISIQDANLIARSSSHDIYKEVMGRATVVKYFFMGHSNSACIGNGCRPQKHMGCFIELMHNMCQGNGNKVVEVLEFFNKCTGTMSENAIETRIKYENKSVENVATRNDPSDENNGPVGFLQNLMKMLAGGGGIVGGRGEFVNPLNGARISVLVSDQEIIIKGDNQPSDKEIYEMLTNVGIPYQSIRNHKIRRVDSHGTSMDVPDVDPALDEWFSKFGDKDLVGLDLNALDKQVTDVVKDESFSDMLARLKSMK